MIDLPTFGVFFAAAFSSSPSRQAPACAMGSSAPSAGLPRRFTLRGVLRRDDAGDRRHARHLRPARSNALAFSLVKWAGARYLMHPARAVFSRNAAEDPPLDLTSQVSDRARQQEELTDVLSPKTARSFCAFIPQLIDPSANAFEVPRRNLRLQCVQRVAAGAALIDLGVYAAVKEERPSRGKYSPPHYSPSGTKKIRSRERLSSTSDSKHSTPV